MSNEIEEKIQSNSLVRIADALEEVLRLVKEDQARTAKRFPEPSHTHEEIVELTK